MRKNILMPDNEPTDEELKQLMHDVNNEVKQRFDNAQTKFNDAISHAILNQKIL